LANGNVDESDVLPVKRTLLPAVLLGFAGLLVADLEPSAATSRPRAAVAPALVTVAKPKIVEVAFHKSGRIVSVQRPLPRGVAPSLHAVKSLLRGPTKEERAKGFRSAIGDDVRLRSLRKDSELWRVSFSQSFFGPGTAQTVQLRLAQVTTTLQRLEGTQEHVAIATGGRLATVHRLGTRPGTWRGRTGEKGFVYSVRGVQLRMYQLGYLARASVTGRLDYLTSQALLAFQGWNDLARTGTITGETQVELMRAERPRPSARRTGRYVEIHRDRGVLLTVEDGVVQRAVHTSTGAGGITPSGSFRVYRKETYSWSVPFSVWMPWASYFIGGIAMHEYPDVPGYPASHGCVRLPAGEAQRVFLFAAYGTPVFVY
jgi:lipoprotein-anchoring transpeptidase ErfK/SrfK